ncbi:MAG: hypothetical protein JW795_20200 [Chitinivibrionales bacterium]|nr:hypothetical protein [Chitinivibrionales bacterium]
MSAAATDGTILQQPLKAHLLIHAHSSAVTDRRFGRTFERMFQKIGVNNINAKQ